MKTQEQVFNEIKCLGERLQRASSFVQNDFEKMIRQGLPLMTLVTSIEKLESSSI